MTKLPYADEYPERPRLRGGWPQRLGEALPGALQRIGPKGVWTEVRLRKVWDEAVGPKIAEHVHVGRLKGKTLIVYASSDAWAEQFRYLAGAVREKINKVVGSDTIAEIMVYRDRQRNREKG